MHKPDDKPESDDRQARSLTRNPPIAKAYPASGCLRNDSLPNPTQQLPIPTIMMTGTVQSVQTSMEQSTATNVVKTKSDHRLY